MTLTAKLLPGNGNRSDTVGADLDLSALLVERDTTAAALAAADAEAYRAEGPRIDDRIGTLLTLLLGALASSGAVGGVGTALSRQRHAYIALGLLVAAAVVLVAGLGLICRLILPRLTRAATPRSWSLAWVAALPDPADAAEHYRAAAADCLAYQSRQAWSNATSIRRRFFRFRTAGRVLLVGAGLAAAGFLALGWGW